MTIEAAQRVRNTTLRRVRLTLRMSQSEFAAAIRHAGDALGETNTCTKRLVQKWESGEHAVCRPNYRRALQAVTRLPYAQLGFPDADTPPTDQTPAPAPAARAADPGATECSDRLRHALERPAGADRATVELIEAATAHLFDREHHEPARHLTATVEQHVAHIARLLSGARREQLRRRLATSGGQAAALAGWLAFDQGRTDDAQRHWDNALRAAGYAADGPLTACVFMFMSYAAEHRGDPATGWQLARSATARAGIDPRTRSWAHVRAAQQAANLADARAAREDLARALDLGAELQPHPPEDTPPWARSFDRCILSAAASRVHDRIGEHRAARSAADTALKHLGPARVKWRAVALAQISHTMGATHDTRAMLDTGTRAADLTEHLEATLARDTLRALTPVLKRHTDIPAARTLLARINTMNH